MALFTHPISKEQYWLYKEYDESIRLAFNTKLIELFKTMIRTFIILGGVAIIVGFIAWTVFRPPLEMVIIAVVASLVAFVAAIIVIVYHRSETNRSRDLFIHRTVGAKQNWLSFGMLNSFAIGSELLQWPSLSDTHWIDEYFEKTSSTSNTAHHNGNSLDPTAIKVVHEARTMIIACIGSLLKQTALSGTNETSVQQILDELTSQEADRLQQHIHIAQNAITQIAEAHQVNG